MKFYSERNSSKFVMLLILALFVLKSISWCRSSIVADEDDQIVELGSFSETYGDRLSPNVSIADDGNRDGIVDPLRSGKSNWRVIPKVEDENIPKLSEEDVIYNWHMDSGAIINEEYKLVFFSVAKAASSEWKLFLMR